MADSLACPWGSRLRASLGLPGWFHRKGNRDGIDFGNDYSHWSPLTWPTPRELAFSASSSSPRTALPRHEQDPNGYSQVNRSTDYWVLSECITRKAVTNIRVGEAVSNRGDGWRWLCDLQCLCLRQGRNRQPRNRLRDGGLNNSTTCTVMCKFNLRIFFATSSVLRVEKMLRLSGRTERVEMRVQATVRCSSGRK